MDRPPLGVCTTQCTDDVLWIRAPETWLILLNSVTPINSIKKKKKFPIPLSLRKLMQLLVYLHCIYTKTPQMPTPILWQEKSPSKYES